MDKHGFTNAADLYNKANISRQLWSSIISEKSHPSLNLCIKIVFTLKLTNAECKLLLKKAGYTLASASKYALIVRYFLETGNYDLNELNDALSEFGYADSLVT
jgi:DNA-binding XRE family transcriptional regulator